jgi:hypothetical protein
MRFKLVEDISEDCLFETKNERTVIKGVIFKCDDQLTKDTFVTFEKPFHVTRLKNEDVYNVYMILRNNFSKVHADLQLWLEKNNLQVNVEEFYTLSYLDSMKKDSTYVRAVYEQNVTAFKQFETEVEDTYYTLYSY